VFVRKKEPRGEGAVVKELTGEGAEGLPEERTKVPVCGSYKWEGVLCGVAQVVGGENPGGKGCWRC
jgi:hypothetical protein